MAWKTVPRTLIGTLLFLSLIPPLGCSNATDGRVAVGGTVQFDGAPLNRGSIELHPKDSAGLHSGGMIREGKFEIAPEQGPTPGKYEVRFFAANEKELELPPEGPGDSSRVPVAKERIPAKYNIKSELEVEIPAAGDRNLQFDLLAK